MILSIQLFGGFLLTDNGQLVSGVQSHPVRSLLAYLVLNRARLQPRQQIAFLLWPDTSEEQARTNLRKAIHFLRQSLPRPDAYLIQQDGCLGWNKQAPFTLDVADFEAAIQAGACEQAVARYAGELLPGHFDEWVILERERLHQQYLDALAQLVQEKETQREYPAALRYARLILSNDPLREEIHRCVMRLNLLNGDRAAAIAAYQACAQVLERELGIEPAQLTQQMYQSLVEQKDFPPQTRSPLLVSPGFNNMTIQNTSFIGRETELRELQKQIEANRLVVITGAGGIGKSRLSIKTAVSLLPHFADGACLVELVSLQDAHLLAKTVAAALELSEVPGWTNQEILKRHLKNRQMLLILDNCEHLIDACYPFVQQILNACSRVSILATSREELGVPGESIYRLAPLMLPDGATQPPLPFESLARYDAIRLFIERARQALPGFALTAENAGPVLDICLRLDGIPLALELAAARLAILSIDQIAGRLDNCFQLLANPSRTSLPRHQTLRALIDWSYQLLDDQERVLLRRLSIFHGSFDLKAVEAICGQDGLDAAEVLNLLHRLDKKSLLVIRRRTNQEVRYGLLEAIRQYGAEKLAEAGEVAPLCQRRLAYFIGLLQNIAPKLSGPEQARWVQRLYLEEDTILASLDWAFNHDLNAALQLVDLFTEYQVNIGISGAYFERICALMAQPEPTTLGNSIAPGSLRANVLSGLGLMAKLYGDHQMAARLLSEALAILRTPGEASAVTQSALGKVLRMLAPELSLTGHREEGLALAEESVALMRETGQTGELAWSLFDLAQIAWDGHQYERAVAIYQESLALHRQAKNTNGMAWCLSKLGGLDLLIRRDFAAAQAKFVEGLRLRNWSSIRLLLAAVRFAQGDETDSLSLLQQVEEEQKQTGYQDLVIGGAYWLGWVMHCRGERAAAAAQFSQSLELSRRLCFHPDTWINCLVGLAAVQESAEAAVRFCAQAQFVCEQHGLGHEPEEYPSREKFRAVLDWARAELAPEAFQSAWQTGRADPFAGTIPPD